MGVIVKYPRAIVLKLASYVNLFLFGVFCCCVGIIIGLFLTISVTAEHIKQTNIELNIEINRLVDSQEEYREWRKHVDDRFTEQQGQMRRLEHLMRVPRSERFQAALNYKYFNYGYGEE